MFSMYKYEVRLAQAQLNHAQGLLHHGALLLDEGVLPPSLTQLHGREGGLDTYQDRLMFLPVGEGI